MNTTCLRIYSHIPLNPVVFLIVRNGLNEFIVCYSRMTLKYLETVKGDAGKKAVTLRAHLY